MKVNAGQDNAVVRDAELLLYRFAHDTGQAVEHAVAHRLRAGEIEVALEAVVIADHSSTSRNGVSVGRLVYMSTMPPALLAP